MCTDDDPPSDDDDPFASYELESIRIDHKPAFDACFRNTRPQLSDYSFANTFIWRDSIRLRWKLLHDCLCVFANGDGGLTLLFPPIGGGDFSAALRESLDICAQYNRDAGYPHSPRVEYVSEGLLENFPGDFSRCPMSGDYVYRTGRMIDLAGGDLASKRQARNRFARRYAAGTEAFGPQHIEPCLDLLRTWQTQSEDSPSNLMTSVRIKREKEILATTEAMKRFGELGLVGMVLYAGDELAGFTFGERLDDSTCSILIEKTDRRFVGAANYIFSEFCRQYWPQTTWCNVGDDWDVPSLAWTKQSYRPEHRLAKWVLSPAAKPAFRAAVPVAEPSPVLQVGAAPSPRAVAVEKESAGEYSRLESSDLADLDQLVALESQCFAKPVAFSRRQWRYMLRCPRASTHVIRESGRVIAEALLLRRKTAAGLCGRIYSIAVAPGHRGRGVGRTLMQKCLDALDADGVSRVYLEVSVENAPAIRLYESFGFARHRRLKDYYSEGIDGWKMVKETTNL
jgi:ribosomal protein S18 acetylase RimI-like enzyme